jgi:hypothetical protein
MIDILDKPYNGSVALVDSVIKTLTFKDAAGVETLAKRVGIKTVFDPVAGYTGKIYYKFFPERQPIAGANDVTSSNVFLKMGENLEQIPAYVSKVQFLSIDPSAVAVSISVEAWSDNDISGAAFA